MIKLISDRYPFYHLINKSSRHLFWREVRPTEVYQMGQICISLCDKMLLKNKKEDIKNAWWDKILSNRFPTRSKDTIKSYLLNYSLFFDHLLLWDEFGYPKDNLHWLYQKENEQSFKFRLQFLLLTTGQLLEIINIIDDMQKNYQNGFSSKTDWINKAAKEFVDKGFVEKESMIKDELSRYFPGIFTNFNMNILDENKFDKSKGYGFNLSKLDLILLYGLFGGTDICDNYSFCKKMGYLK